MWLCIDVCGMEMLLKCVFVMMFVDVVECVVCVCYVEFW